MKNIRNYVWIVLLLFSKCTLAENIQKEEEKDYQDTVHNVELVDYEFEERLNSFYESEPIDSQDLYNLYDGEFPEGERNPKKLRIHWQDARELALAELELQKTIQTSWQDANISERPILVLDREGGDFYRYYEYRIVKDKKYLGAIRIPTYRRTENFATAEVHLYSHDEKTYTIQPTGWGQFMSENSDLNKGSTFYSVILKNISILLQNNNFAFNWYFRSLSHNEIDKQVASPVKKQDMNTILYKQARDKINDVKIPSKNSLKREHLDYISAVLSMQKDQELTQQLIQALGFYGLSESAAQFAFNYGAAAISLEYMSAYQKIFKKAINDVLKNMNSTTRKNFLYKGLSNIFWESLENLLYSDTGNISKDIFKLKWELGTLLPNEDIYPKIVFQEFHKFPIEKNGVFEFQSEKYKYLTVKEFDQFTKPSLYFASKNKDISFISENTDGDYQKYISETIPEDSLTSLTQITYFSKNRDLFDEIETVACQALKFFPNPTPELKNEIMQAIITGASFRRFVL